MKQGFLSWAFVLGTVALGGIGLFGSGCSSDDTPAGCVESKCAPGNFCIDNGTDTKCRYRCDNANGCPFNYHCAPNPKPGGDAYCVQDEKIYPKSENGGQWGAHCATSGGIEDNPDCDSANGFACYARFPGDGNAYCTVFNCESDADCRGGWWCATVNRAPNASSEKPQWGQTVKVCQPRQYCAPCETDLDCGLSEVGTKQYCVDDGSGTKVCSAVCSDDSNCPDYAYCSSDTDAPESVCLPNAGTCKGDGSFCSPCRSDDDCTNGYCYEADYSKERFCLEKSSSPCNESSNGCPKGDSSTNWSVACFTSGELRDYCVGLVKLGSTPGGVPGCWTRNQGR